MTTCPVIALPQVNLFSLQRLCTPSVKILLFNIKSHVSVLPSSESRCWVSSLYLESFSSSMKITVLLGWRLNGGQGHLINRNPKQTLKHSLILSLQYWFFFFPPPAEMGLSFADMYYLHTLSKSWLFLYEISLYEHSRVMWCGVPGKADQA